MGRLTLSSVRPVLEPVPSDTQPPVTVSTEVSGSEWDSYVHRHPDATPDHLWDWRDIFIDRLGQRCEYLAARRGGEVVGLLPLVLFRSLLFGRFGVSVPFLNYGGILASDDEARTRLVERATALTREFGGSHVELRHQSRQLESAPCRDHKVRMVLDLPSVQDQLWKGLDRKVRNQVRKAQKEGLTVASGGAESLERFYAVLAQNMRDLGTPVHSVQLFAAVLRAFPATELHIVEHRGRPVAASLTMRFRDVVLVPWASSLREFRTLCPNMLLYWTMLTRSIAQGAARFDFGRSSRDSGPHQFKQQWGARETALHWEYVLLSRADPPDHGPSNGRLGRAIDLWRRLPLRVTTLAGPRIIRNIP